MSDGPCSRPRPVDRARSFARCSFVHQHDLHSFPLPLTTHSGNLTAAAERKHKLLFSSTLSPFQRQPAPSHDRVNGDATVASRGKLASQTASFSQRRTENLSSAGDCDTLQLQTRSHLTPLLTPLHDAGLAPSRGL